MSVVCLFVCFSAAGEQNFEVSSPNGSDFDPVRGEQEGNEMAKKCKNQ